jgi:hypothetical protein
MEERRNGSQESAIAEEAYIFGYPLVLMDITRQMPIAGRPTNNGEVYQVPANQFRHTRALPDASFTAVVSPNADTLYSVAWLDLSQGPMVLALPDLGDRYCLMQLLDAWTNVVGSPGTRTTGNVRSELVVVGPGWMGKLPPDTRSLRAPTRMLWLIGRTQTNGRDDYRAVHGIQDEYKLFPLGDSTTAPGGLREGLQVYVGTPPVEQLAAMDGLTFFTRLNALMKDNPPGLGDDGAIKRYSRIGVAPGRPFEVPDGERARAIRQGVEQARQRLALEARKPMGRRINGWEIVDNLGTYGTDYLWRAVVAMVGLGANLPQDALYPRAVVDAEGRPLEGSSRYRLRFPPGQHPPVNAFWSVTLYDAGQFFVPNPIHRHVLGDRDRLTCADDGSLTLYIQHDSPGPGREANWLPAPRAPFNLVMRLYWPRKEALQGTWRIPAVERVS